MLFKQIDTNCNGFITVEELKAALDKQNEDTTIL
jgi:Ca2+-binding EF-hand superfamily protein